MVRGLLARLRPGPAARWSMELAIGALGTLVTHELAYSVASLIGTAPVTDHAHMSTLWAVVAPAMLIAVAAFVVCQIRNLGFRWRRSTPATTTILASMFVVQESVEVAAAGHSIWTVAANPAVVVGVALAPVVAWALHRLLTEAVRLTEWLLVGTDTTAIAATVPSPRRPVHQRSLRSTPGNPSSPRAPPAWN